MIRWPAGGQIDFAEQRLDSSESFGLKLKDTRYGDQLSAETPILCLDSSRELVVFHEPIPNTET